jgi:CO/xanthine dehydrogenase Mo-binding subunit
MSERKYRWIGTRAIRPDGLEKVTGRANYGADIALPGMLHGVVLRSPHAHAKILAIDTRKAEKLPGVKAVITAKDLPELPRDLMGGVEGHMNLRELSHNCLARDKVLYHGHALAAVAATTLEIAREAARLIDVKYEVLPPVLDLDSAIAPGATILDETRRTAMMRGSLPDGPTNIASRIEFSRGDLAKGFASADVVIEREFRTPMVHQGYIEPHACTARVGEDGQVTVWCCTQGGFLVRELVATLVGIDGAKVKVIPSEIGGGFGGKTTIYLEPLAILLSRRTGRPVKLVMTREEVFRATGPTSGSHMRVRIGAKQDGTITAAEVWLAYEAGAFKGSPVAPGAMCALALYDIPNVKIEGYDVCVNKPRVAAYRAPGAPISAFAVESVLDELAQKLGLDPVELRLRNAIEEGKQAVYGPKYRAIGYKETLLAARTHPHYRAPLGPNQGRGVASGFWFNAGMQSSAAIQLNEDGTAAVVSGCPDIGGSRASLALMAAEELGLPVEKVRPVVADTETVGYNDLTGGSRVTFATGWAVVEAARDVIRQACERAAKTWSLEPKDVEWKDGAVVDKTGKNVSMPLAEVARKASRTGGPISGRASLNARGAGPGTATHLCDVEVDPETGRVRVLRYTAVQDVGTAIHPSYVEGQMQGGAAQGIGWALNEEYVYDKSGAMENPGFLDYRMPVCSDLPMIDTVIVEVPNPGHPYGVRGAGEVPIVPPLAAVANAIQRAAGVRLRDLPMSPPRVLEAIEAHAR